MFSNGNSRLETLSLLCSMFQGTIVRRVYYDFCWEKGAPFFFDAIFGSFFPVDLLDLSQENQKACSMPPST
jgi:hypothetical protein